ncbi:DNA/RNA non-specific endonuclease [Bacillus albus]|uniref:DNA/RNA non-specific endonuclease n=1 Tax=Bacillus albus TaxID=2026189 RepID=UPI0014199489|nr:DNA/RNA non-specific endonuclease [Bacillus albus]
MSLNMYLGEVQSQTQSMNALCTATIQGMGQAIQSIDAFAVDTVLQGQTYSSAKAFFVQTFRPLAQGIIYLCEELIVQNDAFPSQFASKVASTDVIEQEIREQIQEINQTIASIEAIEVLTPMPGVDAIIAVLVAMRKKLEEKLEHLYEFNYTSSNNYSTALQLASSIATGLAEVQSGKGFSPVSGIFSTQGLNMEWTTSIQAIIEAKERQTDNSIEEGAMCGKLPEKSTGEKIWDGILEGTGQAIEDTIDGVVALGKWETWENMGNAALHPIDTLSTMYNVLSDSFINDVINGDAESRAKWGSYALTQVGLGLIGDKGLSKASKLGKVTTKLAKDKIPEGISHTIGNLQMGNRFAFAGGSGGQFRFNIPEFNQAKDTLLSAKVEYGAHYERVKRRKVLAPDVEYKSPSGHTYKTDSERRITSVEGELKIGDAKRNPYAQRKAGQNGPNGRNDRLKDDDGGHLIASMFEGSGDIDNLVAMNSQINRSGGKWYSLEQKWSQALADGKTVKVKIEPIYLDDSIRPSQFKIAYEINGEIKKVRIKNQAGG